MELSCLASSVGVSPWWWAPLLLGVWGMTGRLRQSCVAVALSLGLLAQSGCELVSEATTSCEAGTDCVFVSANLQVTIPAAAIPSGIEISATRLNNPPASFSIVPGTTWTIAPDGTALAPAGTVAITITSQMLAQAPGVRLAELGVYMLSGSSWVRVPGQTLDVGAMRVTAPIATLTTYTLMGAPAASVQVAPANDTLSLGGSLTLAATARDADGNVLPDRPRTWASSQPGIVSVDANGAIRGMGLGTATITATVGEASGSATITVAPGGNPPPPQPATEPNPGAQGDVILYDDDFSGYASMTARRARRNQLMGGSEPFYFFDGPDDGSTKEAQDAIIAGGVDGSPFAYRITVPANLNNFFQANMYGEVFHRVPAGAPNFNPPGTTLVVDLWLRINYPASNLLWIKGLELFHNFDRTQYGVYLSSATLGWANIHPQSNNREIYMHVENSAADAPRAYRRWTDVANNTWLKHTFVYKASSGTGTQRDGINRWFVNGEKIIDASSAGIAGGWMMDRVNGAQATSTNPYPGNVGDKYTSVTGDQSLVSLADDPVIQIIFPGIFSTSATGGGGTLDIGRVRIWYRP